MTPHELFKLLCDDGCSRYELLKYVDEVERRFIPAFLQDLQDLLKKYDEDQSEEEKARLWNEFYNRCYFCQAMDVDAEFWPEEPNEGALLFIDHRPPLYDFAVSELSKRYEEGKEVPELQQDAGPLPPQHPLNTPQAQSAFEAMAQLGYAKKYGSKWEWTYSAASFGYFVTELNKRMNLRLNENRTNWKVFEDVVINFSHIRSAAGQAIARKFSYENTADKKAISRALDNLKLDE